MTFTPRVDQSVWTKCTRRWMNNLPHAHIHVHHGKTDREMTRAARALKHEAVIWRGDPSLPADQQGVKVSLALLLWCWSNPPPWSSVLCGRPDCCVHLGGVPLPLVWLGVVLSPTLSWRPHVDFLCSRGDRLFHQASAWCLGEGLPLSFWSSVFVTYVLKLLFWS